MKVRRGFGLALLGAGLVVLSCSADRGSLPVETSADADAPSATASASMLPESRAAAARIAELRARFRLPARDALGARVATGFEPAPGADAATHVRAVLPPEALRGVTRAARVALPLRAAGEVTLEDETSHLAVRFALEHVQDTRIEMADGMALYRGALDGADVVHRVHAEGTEDFVVFETRPSREELRYSVDVSRAAGLRLVSNTLEFLDDTGTPLLRVAPPYVVDARGARHDAKLAVSGCAYDTSPAGPWGRTITRPGAGRCAVRVAWGGDIAYPAMVDPAWGATGSMAIGRQYHTASVLLSGKVLVAGGYAGFNWPLASAELFDPSGFPGNGGVGSFAATGSMATARGYHTASVLPSGKVLIAGGYKEIDGPLASAELFAPAGDAGAGTFTATDPMASARQHHTASVLPSGKVLIAGGRGLNYPYLASPELFDPAGNAGAGSFAPTGSMATERAYHTANVLPSGKVLIAGGRDRNDNILASAEVFDAAGNAGAGAFAPTGSMTAARELHTASVLLSGKVLLAGGGGMLASAELFDATGNAGAGAFAPTGWMTTARGRHSASVLLSGKVLLAGGCADYQCGAGVTSAELFDAAGNAGAGAFALTGWMAAARYGHTASVLPAGKVLLVAGGLYDLGGTVASAEVFGGALGEACVTSGYCVSDFCVDGYCCEIACSEGCDRCDLVGKRGRCSRTPSGNPGANPTCGLPYVCDGVDSRCPTSCSSDAVCAASYYCAFDGTCQPRKAQAAACNTQADCFAPGCRECTSNFCVDGFCCNTACSVDGCKACAAALKQSGVADGTCGPIKDGTDPRNECSPSGALCGPDGQCNGTGACRFVTPAGVSCGAGLCSGTVAKGELCDGAGSCAVNAAGVECSPFLCSGGGCTTSCVTSADCADDGWCSAGKCEKRGANGKACKAKEQCATDLCVDGVCCNAPCSGQCEACDVAGAEGTCAPVSTAPHAARAKCAAGTATSPCSTAQCDGTERSSCAGFVGPLVRCGEPSCAHGTATPAGSCNGRGSCKAPAPIPCGAYACGASSCNATCNADQECAAGSSCDLATHKCVSGATCDGNHTTIGATGATQDCAPYKCASDGTCRLACDSAGDCVAPTLCDPSGHCVPPTDDTGGGGGCAARGRGTTSEMSSVTWLAAATALVFARRWRRRRSEEGSR